MNIPSELSVMDKNGINHIYTHKAGVVGLIKSIMESHDTKILEQMQRFIESQHTNTKRYVKKYLDGCGISQKRIKKNKENLTFRTEGRRIAKIQKDALDSLGDR